MSKRNILVTAGLPYANGSIHLGHLVEYIQTDIWVRFQKMNGHQCFYICGSDSHGTPIMLKAQTKNIPAEKLVTEIRKEHIQDFKNFYVAFDNYYTTHSDENRVLTESIYKKLVATHDITTKEIEQAYDAEKNIFLPDRFVKGECPKCGAKDQYGDNCEVCGTTYTPTDLKNPKSVLSGTTPITKKSLHYFFQLPHYTNKLRAWMSEGHLQEQTIRKLDEWFEQGLQAWDISRDAPYFGFEIPDAPGKYFYVWLEAPIGYMASFKNFCDQRDDINFDDYWSKNAKTELYHFIGKDIMYFHSLFWPAVLMGANFRTPTAIYVHGFLTVNGYKMSKSRGTFINASTYSKHLNPEYLRYYFAAKLSSHIEDIDLNLEDFRLRINSDLVGKVVNIASRCAKFINTQFNNKLSKHLPEQDLLNTFMTAGDEIAKYYESREYSQAVRKIMSLADMANQYIDEKKPLALIKEDTHAARAQEICSVGLNLFRLLMLYLKPILPELAKQTECFLKIAPLTWADHQTVLTNHDIEIFQPLMQRIDPADIEKMLEDAKADE